MGKGQLILQVRNNENSLPVADAHIILFGPDGRAMFETFTDANGNTEPLELEAPDKAFTLDETYKHPAYSEWQIDVRKDGFVTSHIHGVEIIDTQLAILPVNLHALIDQANARTDEDIYITPMLPVLPESAQTIPHQEEKERQSVPKIFVPSNPHLPAFDPVEREVFIPDFITVHLGAPTNTTAQNVRIRFCEYVKNVASSEIYATWPHNSLVANVHVIVTFALNRIYTEWYRSRGFSFDITNSTAFDQYYRPGAQIFESISNVVDQYMTTYVHRIGLENPFFTSFCSGTTATCAGLSQWGTVTLANQGLTPIQILRHYYPNDVVLAESDNIRGITESFPGTPLRLGSTGDAVRRMQNDLNRIRVNFPLITQISNPDGTFGEDTERAVRIYQRSFNLIQDGVVGKATWNCITRTYAAVTRMAALDAEGERQSIGETPPSVVLRRGSRGADVREMQFLLNFISQFNEGVPPVIQDSLFEEQDENAVIDFQRTFGLPPDGVVGPMTWNKLYAVYRGIQESRPPMVTPPAPPIPPIVTPPPFPGNLLRIGSQGGDVRQVQTWLNGVRQRVPDIPELNVDGVFGPITQGAVMAFQRHFGLNPDGIVGALTWAELTRQQNVT